MRRLFLSLQYDGSYFKGWQKQPGERTVQSEIENGLSKLNGGNPINIVGCGRTDSGVHASSYFAHFDYSGDLKEQIVCYKLNSILPSDIAVLEVIPVDSNAHARFDATKRTYYYFIHQQKNPFIKKHSLYFRRTLDFSKMNIACQHLLGRKDFTSFSKLHTDVKNNFCTVYDASWIKIENGWRFEISANRFLRNMVRAIVGTMIEVGLNNLSQEDFISIIEAKDRSKAGASAPPEGLFLAEIEYPYGLE